MYGLSIASKPLPMPGTTPQTPAPETVAGSNATSQGAGTPAWVWPVALAVAGFLVTFAFTRKG
jgi:hypothetical protein